MYIEQREIIIRIAVVTLQGRLDAQSTTQLKQVWEEHKTRGVNTILVNLQRVDFIDSLGIAALVSGMKLMRSMNGDLKLIGLQPGPRSIFELMMLDKVFTIYETEEEALHGF
jgi:anti-anti-sigma factor